MDIYQEIIEDLKRFECNISEYFEENPPTKIIPSLFVSHTEETKETMRIKAKQRIERGDSLLCNAEWQKEQSLKRKQNGHGFSNSTFQAQLYEKYQKESFENGTHMFLDPEIRKQNIKKQFANGKHPCQNSALQSEKAKKAWKNMPKVTCPHCGKMGAKPVMLKYHFDKCKSLQHSD